MTEPLCPYCRMPFDGTGPAKVFCTACGMPHHEDCYLENGGCTVFGCSRAPADDPKLQVSQSDLRAVSMPGQPYAGPAQPYAVAAQPQVAVQTAGAPQYPPSIYSGPLGLSRAATASAQPAPAPLAGGSASSPPAQYPYAQPPLPGYPPPVALYGRSQKHRSTYIVLGIFLGSLGVHNFYAGYAGRAVGQLCLSVLSLGYLAIVSWVWALVEICVVTKDAAGLDFH